jgi:hypothetical protein
MYRLYFHFAIGAVIYFTSCAAIASRAATSLPGPNVPDGLGVNIHFTDPRPGEIDMLAAAGFRWVRMDFSWEATERTQGQYDFAAYDRLMAELDKHQMRAIFILDYSNRHYDRGQSPASDEGRHAMAIWAAAAVKHFRSRGVVWEMYNEPNIGFWRPKPDVHQYARLALEVGSALAAMPDEIYIGPATSTIDFKFLEACFQAGLLKYWSAVSVHPYRQEGPEAAATQYDRLRQLIDHYAPKGKRIPIISGEWGYSSAWKNFDETRQGKMLPRQWLTNLAHGVPISIWYDWHDDGPNPAEPEHHFGVVRFPYDAARRPGYQAKPAYLAAKTLTTALDGFHFNRRLPSADGKDYLYAFAKDGSLRYAVWTTGKEHAAHLAVGDGSWQVIDHLGNKRSLASKDGDVDITLIDAPQYVLPQP